MPYDTRDYFRTQMPKYGSVSKEEGIYTVTPGEKKTLATVSGEGTVYQGWISIVASGTLRGTEISIKVDGDVLADTSISSLMSWNFTENVGDIFVVRKYDTLDHRYVVSIIPPITFSESVSLLIDSDALADITVQYALYTAVIEA